MPSTGRVIFSPVDGCFNRNRGKPCFRYIHQEWRKTAVKFDFSIQGLNHSFHMRLKGCITMNPYILMS